MQNVLALAAVAVPNGELLTAVWRRAFGPQFNRVGPT
jgi:hypothetical protein